MIFSTLIAWLGLWASAPAQSFVTVQNSQIVTPVYGPADRTPGPRVIPATHVVPVSAPNQPVKVQNGKAPAGADEAADIFVRTELPGSQTLFRSRDSEGQFYERIRQEVKRVPGSSPAIFPEETPISKESYTQPAYPRLDPVTKLPYARMTELVEPSYVCHRRLLFEQPNFERLGYNFGAAQPIVHMGVFYYDMAMLPYHAYSNLRVPGECSVGKCMPGDPGPFTVPIERFSVTGAIGEAGAILGGMYLFRD